MSFLIYDDIRLIGEFKTKDLVFKSGHIKCHRNTFFKKMREDGFFNKKNIFVFEKGDLAGRCAWLGFAIIRRSRLCPDLYGLNRILSEALKKIVHQKELF